MIRKTTVKMTCSLRAIAGAFSVFVLAGHVAGGETDLFASGDFSGWTDVDGGPVPEDWSIEDGVVHRTAKTRGDIVTKKHYKDFDLTFEWKISQGGNSGVKYRTRGSLGLEYQVIDDGGG